MTPLQILAVIGVAAVVLGLTMAAIRWLERRRGR